MRSWHGRGSVMVRSRCGRSRFGHGMVALRSWYSRGTVTVRSQYGRGSVAVRSWYGRGVVKVLSRYTPDSLVVRHAQGSFTPRRASNLVHALYDLLFAVRSRCGQVLSGYAPSSLVVRYTQGSFPPGILTSLEPGTRTVRSSVRVVQSRLSGIRFARFSPR